ncbi:MAG: ATP-grasp domain-containing protein [Clostridiales bacterium]|nr:ATP-grasp domain-containing protein [Clostridiales bacterium]
MQKKIMILGASILQLPAIEKAIQMGLSVVAVDMNADAVGFRVPGVTKEVISTIDIPEIVKAAKRHSIDGIMTLATDMPMRSVAAVSKEMGFGGIDEDAVFKATNKIAMRIALKDKNVPVPNFFKASDKAEYLNAVKSIGVPFIVKPADSSGSRGIFKVSDLEDKKLIDEAYSYARTYSREGDVIVEEYMSGPEVSVETISLDGVCHIIRITDKITTGAPHFVEMGHSQPTCLDAETVKRISEVTVQANKAIGIKCGPSHTEIIVTQQGPKIVELGARLGGDNITTHLVPMSTGVDMVECCIKIALGEKPDISQKWDKGAAVRYFRQRPGVVKSICGIEEAKRIPGVKQISVVHSVGEEVTDITGSGARIGFVIAQDENAKAAIADCEKALSKIKIEIG